MGLFAGMPFEAHRVGPTQVATLFGEEIEKRLEGRDAALDGSGTEAGGTLLIDKRIDIVQRDGAPRLGTHRDELAHIANIIYRCAPTGEAPGQVLGKLGNALVFHSLASGQKSCPVKPTQYKAAPLSFLYKLTL